MLSPLSTSLPGDTATVPLNYKFGILVPSDRQPRSIVTLLADVINTEHHKDFVWILLLLLFSWLLLLFLLFRDAFIQREQGKICVKQKIYLSTSWYSFVPLYMRIVLCRTEKGTTTKEKNTLVMNVITWYINRTYSGDH